jgi:DNA-binding NarL/FixJ family response regulator
MASKAKFSIAFTASGLISDWGSCVSKIVLVVDDNESIRHALCRIFTSESGFDVCGEAENGKEAIEKALELRPDVVVMDLSMPLMNGIEAVAALKKLLPSVPVIIFSEYSDVFTAKEALSAGVSVLVSKSEHISVLLSHVRRLCNEIAA